MEAYGRENYVTALKEIRPLAEQGNAFAQYFIGILYKQGSDNSFPQNYKEAVKWFQFAANQGFPVAQNELGQLYERGRVVWTWNGNKL